MEKRIVILRGQPLKQSTQPVLDDCLLLDLSGHPADGSGQYIPGDGEMTHEERESGAAKITGRLERNIGKLRYVSIAVSALLKQTEKAALEALARLYKDKKFTITLLPAAGDVLAREEESLSILKSAGVCAKDIVLAGIVPNIDDMDKLFRFSGSGIHILYSVFFDEAMSKGICLEEQLVSIKYLIKLGFINNILLSAGMNRNKNCDLRKENIKLTDRLKEIGLEKDQISKIFWQNPYRLYFG